MNRRTRLAPSPTGALHLGNARTFIVNWALARQNGWDILLRIEDLDTPRTKPGADAQAIDDLRWLGLDWDQGPAYQLADLSPYARALEILADAGQTYPCAATRREIASAQSAPHGEEHEHPHDVRDHLHELRYPGMYRPADDGSAPPIPEGAQTAVRLRVPDRDVSFRDELQGPRTLNVQRHVGDFVLSTKNGLPAYQLAVVIDDARQGITDVVRGDDLLDSTARQVLLYETLDLGPPPRYFHLPMVYGEDGRRLAKRHGDTRLARYRQQNVPAQRVIGLLAFWSGVQPQRQPMEPAQFRERFALDTLPRNPITFTAEDDAWLLSKP